MEESKKRESHGKVRVNYNFRARIERYHLPNGKYMECVRVEEIKPNEESKISFALYIKRKLARFFKTNQHKRP